MELVGIKILENNGERRPYIAKLKPITLYKSEMSILSLTVCIAFHENSTYWGSNRKLLASKMALHAGEKLLISSEILIPRTL